MDSCAGKASANLVFFGRTGQFGYKYSYNAATLEHRMRLMEVANTASFLSYHNSNDKVFFTLNNEERDRGYLQELADASYLCISSANSNSLFIGDAFYGLFGNNRSFRSIYYLLEIFSICSGSHTNFHKLSFLTRKSFCKTIYRRHYPKISYHHSDKVKFGLVGPLSNFSLTDSINARLSIQRDKKRPVARYDQVQEYFEIFKTHNYLLNSFDGDRRASLLKVSCNPPF